MIFWLVRHPPVSTRTVKGAFKHLPALDGLGARWYHTTSQNKSMDNQQILVMKMMVWGLADQSTRKSSQNAEGKHGQSTDFIEMRYEHMKLKYIVPNMAQTFGNLEFAGENDVEQQRVNGRFVPVTRSYNLYSDIQRADDIIVVLPAKAGEKRFKYEQKVKLVNPKITAEGKNVRGRGYTNYILTADDMLPAEESK